MHVYDAKNFLEKVPDGFEPYQQWPEYAYHLNMPRFFRPCSVGTYPLGMRRSLWPLTIEEYVSDTEPVDFFDPKAPNRFILWQRITRQDIPPGWKQVSKRNGALIGFSDLTDTKDYTQRWARVARYEQRLWNNTCAAKYSIEQVGLPEYEKLFQNSIVGKKIGMMSVNELKRKLAQDQQHIVFWAVRNLNTGRYVAGIGVINSPTHCASYYASGCMRDVPTAEPVMIGLLGHWFKESQASNLRFLHFGEYWIPGKPKSWRGFSSFKSKFKPHYLLYPPVLYKFKRGRIF